MVIGRPTSLLVIREETFLPKTSKASYVSKARRVILKNKILNGDPRKKLKTEKLKKKLKTQEKKTQNSSQKLKNSAFLRPLHAEKMAKKPACVNVKLLKP